MKQYDVVGIGRSLAVILQHDGMDALPTVFVAPLLDPAEQDAIPKLCPAVKLSGESYVVSVPEMAAVSRRQLRRTQDSLVDYADDFRDALDRFFLGL